MPGSRFTSASVRGTARIGALGSAARHFRQRPPLDLVASRRKTARPDAANRDTADWLEAASAVHGPWKSIARWTVPRDPRPGGFSITTLHVNICSTPDRACARLSAKRARRRTTVSCAGPHGGPAGTAQLGLGARARATLSNCSLDGRLSCSPRPVPSRYPQPLAPPMTRVCSRADARLSGWACHDAHPGPA